MMVTIEDFEKGKEMIVMKKTKGIQRECIYDYHRVNDYMRYL